MRDADLGALASTLLAPYQRPECALIRIEGPTVVLPRDAVNVVGLMLHELATNALKYGALCTDQGHVDVTWRTDQSGPESNLLLEWRESGGPKITGPPPTAGFGTQMLSRLAGQSSADLHFDWRHDGLLVTLKMPFKHGRPHEDDPAIRG